MRKLHKPRIKQMMIELQDQKQIECWKSHMSKSPSTMKDFLLNRCQECQRSDLIRSVTRFGGSNRTSHLCLWINQRESSRCSWWVMGDRLSSFHWISFFLLILDGSLTFSQLMVSKQLVAAPSEDDKICLYLRKMLPELLDNKIFYI